MQRYITLNRVEKKLVELLRSVSQSLRDPAFEPGIVRDHDQEFTPRIAGGWVRDKLLNLESSDIDVCVEGISGVDFARAVAGFQKERQCDWAHSYKP